MKHRIISLLQSAALALAAWLLPTTIFATVEVDGITYELDEATHTAVVAPQTNKELTSAIIPGTITIEGRDYTVTAIGECAFLDCHDLHALSINGSSITSIGFSAFERCYSLSTLYLNEGLTTIGSEAFKDCLWLHEVALPSTLLKIGYWAFYGCNSLTAIIIPKDVTALGDECLSGTSLQVLTVERTSPLSVRASALAGIDKASCVLSVPEGSKAAYQKAKVWREFKYIEEYPIPVLIDGIWYILDKTLLTAEVVAPVKGSPLYQGDVVIPESVEYEGITYSVTSIGMGAFMGCTELTSLTIPPSLTEMWDDAIDGCSALQRINISDLSAWLRVEGKAYYLDFVGNSTISTIPLYLNGEPLCEVVIPGDIETILGCSFYGAPLITSLYIPDNSVYRIDYFAFFECSNLTFAKFGNSVGSLGYFSFIGTNLKTLIINNDATPPSSPSLDEMVFDSRDIPLYVPYGSLSTYQNDETNPYHPGQTFKFFRNMREFIISPDSIYYGLDPETQTAKVISTDFYVMDEAPTDVRIPETIDCDGVTYTVTALGLKAFELSSAMTRLTLPGTITSVDDEVLNRCTALTEVYCYAEEVPAATGRAFWGSSASQAVLYVPAASLEAYRAASPWNTFADIRPITTTAISQLDASGDAAPEVTYGIDGRIVTSSTRGVTIVRRGDKVMKVMR